MFEFVLEDINAGDVLGDYALVPVFSNTNANEAEAVVQATLLIESYAPVAVFGSVNSEVTRLISLIATHYRIPHVAYVSGSAEFSDKKRHPYFSRIIPPITQAAVGLARLVHAVGWRLVRQSSRPMHAYAMFDG